MKWALLLVTVCLATILVACNAPTQVQSAPAAHEGQVAIPTPGPVAPGGEGSYAQGYALPAVTTIYSVTGIVQAAPGQVQHFTFEGRTEARQFDGYGYASGYIGGGTSGKGFVRFEVTSLTWHDPYEHVVQRGEDWAPVVKVGDTILLKTEDTKATALGAGDMVTFLCREDQEFVAPAAVNEIPTLRSVTRELDNCRMIGPQFTPTEKSKP